MFMFQCSNNGNVLFAMISIRAYLWYTAVIVSVIA